MIRVIKPGALTTIQDLGRTGFAHVGLSAAGAADSLSFRIGNLLVGNHPNAPALEITLLGPTLEFESRAIIAIAGSRTSTSILVNEAFEVALGEKITIGSLLDGARAYLAVRGGISLPEVMGSCSTFLPARIGGIEGRALRAGDRLAIGARVMSPARRLSPAFFSNLGRSTPQVIRVTPSLQHDWFSPQTINSFAELEFTVSGDSNRSGVRLLGEPIRPATRRELLTEGVALGAVQVPQDGQPIILFVDQQTTGGYPKIANVMAADLPRIGQLRPRDKVRFEFVTIAEAVELLRQQEQALSRAFTS